MEWVDIFPNKHFGIDKDEGQSMDLADKYGAFADLCGRK